MKSKSDILTWIDQLIEKGKAAITSARSNRNFVGSPGDVYVSPALVAGFRSAGLSLVKAVCGEQHPYFIGFSYTCQNQYPEEIEKGIQVLIAIREEIGRGYIEDVRQLLRSEIFADFLEMAEHLLEQGYKEPAAVMVGSVLEDYLRQLAAKHDVPVTFAKDGKQVPKKADTINADLKKAEAYGQLDQKSVTMWLDLRNNAAHGKYDQYTGEQVKLMLQGVLDFVRRVSIR